MRESVGALAQAIDEAVRARRARKDTAQITRRAAALGCEGKWAIHPSQVALANEVFSPTEAEVTKARRIIAELKVAEAAGKGAASLDGKMIDAASERMARNVLVIAEAIAAE